MYVGITADPNKLLTVADSNCIFCQIIAGTLPATIVAEDELTISFMDINPATTGHALVIPRTHTDDLLSIGVDDLQAVILAAQRLALSAKRNLQADGVNLVNSCGAQAWQTVFHFHMHVIPRYEGDPLKLPWEPTPGDPEQIAAAAAALQSR
jgi:histidine triad (HIT) family protein